jgi:hypothetical protein
VSLHLGPTQPLIQRVQCTPLLDKVVESRPPPSTRLSVFGFKFNDNFAYENICLLQYCVTWSGRDWPTFQGCLLSPSSGLWCIKLNTATESFPKWLDIHSPKVGLTIFHINCVLCSPSALNERIGVVCLWGRAEKVPSLSCSSTASEVNVYSYIIHVKM